MSKFSDKDLGMDRAITRREFLDGAAMLAGGAMLEKLAFASQQPDESRGLGEAPPLRTGMRGSHPGSFEIAHSLRDGTFWEHSGTAQSTGETYDLVVVGGGISGLAAAHFFREAAGKDTRILILDNHDDFGGHAKRNEFHLGGRLQLMNGGTLAIDSPTPYSAQADGLLKKLGVDPPQLEARCADREFYKSMGLRPAVFFDEETFGKDKLVVGVPGERDHSGSAEWEAFLARTPLSERLQHDILRIESAQTDYMPGLSSDEKKARLTRMSYRDFLLNVARADPGVIPYYQTRTHGEWGVGIDAEPALDCWGIGLPGFRGLKLEPGAAPNMSYTGAGYASGSSYYFHFPDGNASVARLLVRDLIPEAMPGKTAEDVVTAQADYTRLDRPGSPVRIRLNSTVVRAQHPNGPAAAKEVEVSYVNRGQLYTVRGKGAVMACWNTVIPYLVPKLPQKQKDALHYLVKVPLVYTSVGLRNWTAFQKLKVSNIEAPGSYWLGVTLNPAVNIGDYRSAKSPDEPILLRMSRTPCKPGLPVRDQQKAGRYELLATNFETFERNIRDLLFRCLGEGGFDPRKDIEAITVNRWPHGYGYEYNPLFDPQWPEGEQPHVIGRKKFGRITIANTDSAATAYTDAAIDQAYRAVKELFES